VALAYRAGSATTIKRKKKGFDLKRARDDRVPR
jgi:hypothetical protein